MTTRKQDIGLPPGSLVYKGPNREHSPKLSQIKYNAKEYLSKEFVIHSYSDDHTTVDWIDIDGVHEVDVVQKIGQAFNLHPLLLEDVLDTNQRPSVEEIGEYVLVKLKMMSYDEGKKDIDSEQVSVVLGNGFVITFQEKTGDVFTPLRDRIKNSKGKIRNKKSDYLFYAIIDIIVDNYFTIIEEIGNEMAKLETEVFEDPNKGILEKIQRNKKHLLTLRKNIYPLREVVAKFQKHEYKLILSDTSKYFDDLYNNIIHIIDTIESYRDINSGLKDSYISGVSLKMNQVMHVLTIMSSIFIPITFLAGIYGMNFEKMPELQWEYGYMLFWVLVIIISGFLLLLFKRKKWL